MKAFKTWGLLLFILVGLYTMSNAAWAATDPSDCSKCHGTSITDFDVTDMDRTIQCAKCHSKGSHAKWKDPVTGRIKYSVLVSDVGYFRTADTINSTSSQLHSYHSGNNNYSTTAGCNQCHGTAKCTSCHTAVNHENHGKTQFPPANFMQADGTSYSFQTVSCALSECHRTMPQVLMEKPDGNQLCVNCHPRFGAEAKDLTGHDQKAINSAHITLSAGSLTIAGKTYSVTCQGCHQTNLASEHAQREKDCLVCHSPELPIPPAVKTVVTNSNGVQDERFCTKCHFNTDVLILPTEHKVFHVAIKSNNLSIIGGPHNECDTCHGKQELWSTIYSIATSNPKEYSCLDCHNSQNDLAPIHHAGLEGDLMEVTATHPGCNTCHTPGTEAADKVNQIISRINDGAQGYECMDCHSWEGLDEEHVGIIDSNCTTTCHKSTLTQEHLNNPVTQDKPLTCGDCHADSRFTFAIATGNSDCSACHYEAHNFNIIQQMPVDIPKYDGFIWSIPQNADIWADEPWFNIAYELNGKRVLSNRRSDVSISTLENYYVEKMRANGWNFIKSDNANNTIVLDFTKDKRQATIYIYDTDVPYGGTKVSAGYRLDIFYKQ